MVNKPRVLNTVILFQKQNEIGGEIPGILGLFRR